ncbi:hypothetical protein EXIGLDRAFT_759145 [Exidia glandulosa HHB12029]|uniref:Uncharacterized protein n=1 Tax=Exidia glandulosa HHB12029 TaxID=1314781 RepID=A0A165Q991_EXIGL|nr:hypothetical protein EXIGLDRAFT_759145 [Exidia glandulosa HHB12029]
MLSDHHGSDFARSWILETSDISTPSIFELYQQLQRRSPRISGTLTPPSSGRTSHLPLCVRSTSPSFDDGATLYHPDHEPASPTLIRRRYTLLAAHKTQTLAMDKHHAFGYGFDQEDEATADVQQYFPLAPLPPTRSIARRSSAPDLRLLRGRLSNIALDSPATELIL